MDEYGGSNEHRAKILVDILHGLQKTVPRQHITIKINSSDFHLCTINKMETLNAKTGQKEIIGSYYKCFDDI